MIETIFSWQGGDGHIDYYKYPDNLRTIGKPGADIFATMFINNFIPSDTVSFKIYVDNTGGSNIDDFLRITITDPNGQKVYIEIKPIYVETGDIEAFRIGWDIPTDATKGPYKLKVEFDNLDIDFLPSVRTVNVN